MEVNQSSRLNLRHKIIHVISRLKDKKCLFVHFDLKKPFPLNSRPSIKALLGDKSAQQPPMVAHKSIISLLKNPSLGKEPGDPEFDTIMGTYGRAELSELITLFTFVYLKEFSAPVSCMEMAAFAALMMSAA